MRKTIRAAILLFILPAALAARPHKSGVRKAASSPLHPANKRDWNNLRALAPNAMLEVAERNGSVRYGTFVRFSESSIVINENRRARAIFRDHVTSVKVVRKLPRWASALLMGALYAGPGAGLGAASGGSIESSYGQKGGYTGEGAAIGAGVLGVAGAGLGLLEPFRTRHTVYQTKWIERARVVSREFEIFMGPTVVSSQCSPTYPYVSCGQNALSLGVTTFHQVGWEFSGGMTIFHGLGVIADVSEEGGQGNPEGPQLSALFGPIYELRLIPRVVPFAHALFGVANGQNSETNFPSGQATTESVYATAFGGGVDVKVAGPLWIRVLQAESFHANFLPDHRTNIRYSAGIVIRLGRH